MPIAHPIINALSDVFWIDCLELTFKRHAPVELRPYTHDNPSFNIIYCVYDALAFAVPLQVSLGVHVLNVGAYCCWGLSSGFANKSRHPESVCPEKGVFVVLSLFEACTNNDKRFSWSQWMHTVHLCNTEQCSL